MLEVLGYAALLVLGIVLGLIGAGGSILVVPVLVYLFGVSASQATGYSLLVVGATALVGAIEYLRRKQADLKLALTVGTPSIAGVYLTRRWLFPAIPDPVLTGTAFTLSKDTAVMIVFAVFMLVASISMIRRRRPDSTGGDVSRPANLNLPIIVAAGLAIGVFAGLVGAGGGFMILPVLVLMGGLPMKVAIGTDLLIIASQSLLGFVGEAQAAEAINYAFAVGATVLPLVGIAVGTYLNRIVPSHVLQTAFGWFVLVMGHYIVIRELFL
jgi:uncharacterized membrane protein YfcA